MKSGTAEAGVTGEPGEATGPLLNVDIAYLVGRSLLVYGWVLDFGRLVAAAEIHLGDQVIDLAAHGILLPRPDVSRHFGAVGDDHHGFFLILDLPREVVRAAEMRLSLLLVDGSRADSLWPLTQDPMTGTILRRLGADLADLAARLAPVEAARLADLLRLHGVGGPEETQPQAGRAELPDRVQLMVDRCCVLQNAILFVYGWVLDPDASIQEWHLEAGGRTFDLATGITRLVRADLVAALPPYAIPGLAPRHGYVFAAALPAGTVLPDHGVIKIVSGGGTRKITQVIVTDSEAADAAFQALLDVVTADLALSVIERVGSAAQTRPEAARLARWLAPFARRPVEKLPSFVNAERPRCHLHIDLALPVGDGVFLSGWYAAEAGAGLTVRCHGAGSVLDLEAHWLRHARPDVRREMGKSGATWATDRFGFLCHVPLRDPETSCYLEVAGPTDSLRLRIDRQPAQDPLSTIKAVLTSFNEEHPDLLGLFDRLIGPLTKSLWASRRKPQITPIVRHYGARIEDPEISVIVPLYGRWDLAEYQLALFADDPDFQTNELIYVIDDPTIADAFIRLAPGLSDLYDVPFTIAFSGENLGFGGANNFGADLARGRYLLLLNSDVFPTDKGWLDRLVDVYASLPDTAVLGTKLLYEDGGLQHAGMAFRRHQPWGGFWINQHPLKGQRAAGLDGVREVDAVTAACALIETQLYRDLGGFSDDYIIGDFEDSDLCLRAAETGRRNRVALDIELYHLERQSQNRVGSAQWRINLTLYNCWVFNDRWGRSIAERQA